MSKYFKRLRQTRTETERVRITPVVLLDLAQLRMIVEASKHLPDSARVYVDDLVKASHESPEAYAFRGMTVAHAEVVEVEEEVK